MEPVKEVSVRSQNRKRRLMVSISPFVFPSVRPSVWNNSAPIRRIFLKFDISVFFENMLGKFKFNHNLTKIALPYMRTYVHLWKFFT
jgi:hypothetical protein